MESLGQSYGAILYRTDISGLGDQELRIVEPHDFAIVFLNGQHVGSLDRRTGVHTLKLTNVPEQNATLDILIDTLGRVNFGHKMLDRKGITERVEYGGLTLMNWTVFPLPLDSNMLAALHWSPPPSTGPAFHRGSFTLAQLGDTFLDLRGWGRGVVWINGHCLGRFWHIGPQQTLFLPAPWLQLGQNEVILLDMDPRQTHSLAALPHPILDELHETASTPLNPP